MKILMKNCVKFLPSDSLLGLFGVINRRNNPVTIAAGRCFACHVRRGVPISAGSILHCIGINYRQTRTPYNGLRRAEQSRAIEQVPEHILAEPAAAKNFLPAESLPGRKLIETAAQIEISNACVGRKTVEI